MGAEKIQLARSKRTRMRFLNRLLEDLSALEYMIDHAMFEKGIQRIGIEQELCFIDKRFRPASIISEVLPRIDDPHFVTEIAQFNMEVNLDPMLLTGSCFHDLESDLYRYLAVGERAAAQSNAHVLLTGILPTVRRSDIHMRNLTPIPRYKILIEMLKYLRGGLFEFRIEGTDQLITKDETAIFEGCNTSFQVHYQVTPENFAPLYNWSLAISGPLMAASTNSPLLLGKRLWRETRIALFQQAVDTRSSTDIYRERIPRVSFGKKWIQKSITEIYRDNIARHPVLISSVKREDPLKVLADGGIPKLDSLNIHNGTIWYWNRACYGVTGGKPHLRIENRILPSGPSVVDEVANAAFWIGMMHGLPDQYHDFKNHIEFDAVKSNFLKAARQGLGAYFWWPGHKKQLPSSELILKELLPIARAGLKSAKIHQTDIDKYLDIIEERVETGKTGSQWLVDGFRKLRPLGTKDEALVAIVAGLHKQQQKKQPVHTWALPELQDAGDANTRYGTIEQIMVTDLLTVHIDDPIDFVINVMKWENIRHLPVEDKNGDLVGLVSSKSVIKYMSRPTKIRRKSDTVQQIMLTNVLTVNPHTPTVDALEKMRTHNVGCLPVVNASKIIGIVTEHDFLHISAQLFADHSSDKEGEKKEKND